MHHAGIETDDPIVADGNLHRVRVNGDMSGRRNGWYILYSHPTPTGAFGCWKRGISQKWVAKSESKMTPAERETHRQQIQEAQAKAKAERERLEQKACGRAEKIWQAAEPASVDHPYLRSKGIAPNGARLYGNCLVLPLRDPDAVLHSLQCIRPDGAKRFLADGRISGCFHILGKPERELYEAEGFATGATIHEATGKAVAVAFSAGNL